MEYEEKIDNECQTNFSVIKLCGRLREASFSAYD